MYSFPVYTVWLHIYTFTRFVGEVCEPVPCENGADCPSTPAEENVSCEFLSHF